MKKSFLISMCPIVLSLTVNAAEPQRCEGQYPLHSAAQEGNVARVKKILASGYDANKKKNNGRTPLHEAADYGHIGVVQVLCDAGACVNEKDKDGDTPLYLAAENGRHAIAQVLLEAMDHVNEKMNDYQIPLYLAAYHEIAYLIHHWQEFVKGLNASIKASHCTLLMSLHPRCGAHSLARSLLPDAIRGICSYLQPGRCIYNHEMIQQYVAITQQQQGGAL